MQNNPILNLLTLKELKLYAKILYYKSKISIMMVLEACKTINGILKELIPQIPPI